MQNLTYCSVRLLREWINILASCAIQYYVPSRTSWPDKSLFIFLHIFSIKPTSIFSKYHVDPECGELSDLWVYSNIFMHACADSCTLCTWSYSLLEKKGIAAGSVSSTRKGLIVTNHLSAELSLFPSVCLPVSSSVIHPLSSHLSLPMSLTSPRYSFPSWQCVCVCVNIPASPLGSHSYFHLPLSL